MTDANVRFWDFYNSNREDFERILWNACWMVKRRYEKAIDIEDLHSSLILRLHRSKFLDEFDPSKALFITYVTGRVNGYALHYLTGALREILVIHEDEDGTKSYAERFESCQEAFHGHAMEDDNEVTELYNSLIQDLTLAEKKLARLYFIDGYSVSNIAAILGVQPSRVKADLYNIRETCLRQAERMDLISRPDHSMVCEIKNLKAYGETSNKGFIVFKKSEAALHERDCVKKYPWPLHLRTKLKDEGVLKVQGDKLVFTKDYVFPSSSTAAAVVYGGHANGPSAWKDKTGTYLKDLKG